MDWATKNLHAIERRIWATTSQTTLSLAKQTVKVCSSTHALIISTIVVSIYNAHVTAIIYYIYTHIYSYHLYVPQH